MNQREGEHPDPKARQHGAVSQAQVVRRAPAGHGHRLAVPLVRAFRAQLAAGDPTGDTMAPWVKLTLAMVSYAFRPESRMLPAA